jgi:hypothetical protein
MIGYVTLNLFRLAGVKCVPTGERRNSETGEVEAEFLCIEPGTNCEKVWATREMIKT